MKRRTSRTSRPASRIYAAGKFAKAADRTPAVTGGAPRAGFYQNAEPELYAGSGTVPSGGPDLPPVEVRVKKNRIEKRLQFGRDVIE